MQQPTPRKVFIGSFLNRKSSHLVGIGQTDIFHLVGANTDPGEKGSGFSLARRVKNLNRHVKPPSAF
jgi:hypothetical protein